jgi:RNA polymerase sigma-70 factor (ECF subfamily)
MTAIHGYNPMAQDAPARTPMASDRLTMTQATNPSLLQQVAAGQGNAVAEVIDAYGGLVWSLARKYFGRSAEAEDAVQDAFIAVWKAADRYDPEVAAESTYIAMIARRRMIDQLRKAGRRIDAQPLDSSPEPENESNNRLADEEQVEAVLKAIDELDPPQPEVIRHSLMDGLTHPEIAEKMGLPLGTVKTHIRRGLIKVRQALGICPETAGATS